MKRWGVFLGIAGSIASLVALALVPDVKKLVKAVARCLWTNHPHFLVLFVTLVFVVILAVRHRSSGAGADGGDELARQSDLKLLAEFHALLPFDRGAMSILKNQDFGGRFDNSLFDPLRVFVSQWVDAQHQFLDPQIESSKKRLLETTDSLYTVLCAETFRVEHDNRRQEVPRELRDSRDPELRRKYEDVTRRLNNLADDVVAAHQEFVGIARKCLRP